jgi:hypothetical protein
LYQSIYRETMGNLFNALNDLKTNIFGGGNTGTTTPILRKTAIDLKDTSPTSMLSNDPFQFTSISYPRKQISEYSNGHYMLFYVNVQNKSKYKYSGYDAQGNSITVGNQVEYEQQRSGSGNQGSTTAYRDGDGSKEFRYQADLAERQGKDIRGSDGVTLNKIQRKRGSGMSSYLPTTSRITDSVAIYLPPNVQDTTTASYTGAATGVIGAAAAGAFGIGRNMANNDFEAAATGIVNAAKSLIGEAAIRSATAIAEGLTESEGARGLINKAFGQADNPYMEVLFDKMELRTFSYNFKFAPRNKDERDDVQKIIALFRFHMAPELKGANNRFLTLPSEFDIHYMYQHKDGSASENDFYNRIATCVCTGCVVDYTPDGVKSFDDGSPTQITMTLTFQETELLTKERVNEGY